MDAKLKKAAQGLSASQGGLNIPEIKKFLFFQNFSSKALDVSREKLDVILRDFLEGKLRKIPKKSLQRKKKNAKIKQKTEFNLTGVFDQDKLILSFLSYSDLENYCQKTENKICLSDEIWKLKAQQINVPDDFSGLNWRQKIENYFFSDQLFALQLQNYLGYGVKEINISDEDKEEIRKFFRLILDQTTSGDHQTVMKTIENLLPDKNFLKGFCVAVVDNNDEKFSDYQEQHPEFQGDSIETKDEFGFISTVYRDNRHALFSYLITEILETVVGKSKTEKFGIKNIERGSVKRFFAADRDFKVLSKNLKKNSLK